MNDNSSVQTRMDELIALVAKGRDAKREEILSAAHAEAELILKNAHHNARKRVGEVIAQERRNLAEAQNSVRAHLESGQRRHRMKEAEALVKAGRAQLEQAMLQRWQDATARGAWLDFVATQAIRFLPQGHWQLVCAEGVDMSEIDKLKNRVDQKRSCQLSSQSEAALKAGLKVGCLGAWVDGTLEGLLADSRSIDAQLLGLITATGEHS